MSAEEANASLLERIQRPEVSKETAKKIALVEEEFVRAEVEQLRQSTLLLRPLFEKRSQVIAEPDVRDTFWTRVMLNAPAEVEEHITMTDATILATTLKNLTVERFDIDEKGQGEPRSFRLTFEFRTGDENPYFENEKLVKDFHWRKQVLTTSNGHKRTWDGLVSEPVRINWKKDQDPTKGLLDAACDLAEAEKKGGDRKKLPEFAKVVKIRDEIEAAEEQDIDEDEMPEEGPGGMSFFAFFGYRGSDVTAEHSQNATKEDNERFEKLLKGEPVEGEDEDDDEDDDIEDDFEEVEVFPAGDELAVAIAEDLWPNALKYYVTDQSIEDLDFDESELDLSADEEDEEEEDARPRKKTKV
ncbi:hypothetical protein BO94DRAFT_493248 [Aspergillus sclerotioniger CBS 115572]|uniref:NAP family protein n=1 Tax=Aspergillus sclerotioniger CBS 115572 TaxID=1450535 RepID=A0A317WJ58_9EURO|nr:hypothetical protein BO94DRAFT_493248 [Aspergillus sclerotioniger CBS 115572]PWY86494.1 hypothetical protein BO94DRAFT_493248 [Aspergillus sclerotioniger CBS 115572]